VSANDLVPLRCRPDTLEALATNLVRFGPAAGAPEWLVSAVWLCTPDADFLATATIEVQSDGYLARPLNIDQPAEVTAGIEAELPDIQGRLISRGSDLDLPPGDAIPGAPANLAVWPAGPYAMSVLVRLAERALVTSRVACALLFAAEGGASFLVGSDSATMAMVFSEDAALIDRYRRGCDELQLGDYQRLSGA
jgi:hypothetical protein